MKAGASASVPPNAFPMKRTLLCTWWNSNDHIVFIRLLQCLDYPLNRQEDAGASTRHPHPTRPDHRIHKLTTCIKVYNMIWVQDKKPAVALLCVGDQGDE
jgi:hypothetical protein